MRQTDPVFKAFPGSTRAGKTAMLRVLSIGKLMSGMHGALSVIELIAVRLWQDIHDLVESLDAALSAPEPAFGPEARDAVRTLLLRLKLRQAEEPGRWAGAPDRCQGLGARTAGTRRDRCVPA